MSSSNAQFFSNLDRDLKKELDILYCLNSTYSALLTVNIYIPLIYSEKVKRPDKKYILNNIIGEDFLILLLAFTYNSYHPLSNALGLLILQISFWCIYELGYIENDIIGEKFEDKAVLSYNYKSFNYSFSLWQPWIWSLCLSIIGVIFLSKDIVVKGRLDSVFFFRDNNPHLLQVFEGLLLWLSFLLFLRALFHIYNHLNKQSRVWFYLLLQACRYCGYLVLLTTSTIGVFLLFSAILTRSIQYILYRYLGGKSNNWPMDFPKYFFCLLIFWLSVVLVAANTRDWFLIANFQVLLISIFCIARGSKQFYKVLAQFVHVKKDSSNRVT